MFSSMRSNHALSNELKQQAKEWSSPWERNTKGQRLSVIVSTVQARPSIIPRDYDPLRPVFIDGPSIAHAYDASYRLNAHLRSRRRRRPMNVLLNDWRTPPAPHKLPIQPLVQMLFTFIARGHRSIVLLPLLYDEHYNQTNTKPITDAAITELVDDVDRLRKLVKMKLIEFPSDLTTSFRIAIRNRSKQAHGVLVTCNLIRRLDVPTMKKPNNEEEDNVEPLAIKSDHETSSEDDDDDDDELDDETLEQLVSEVTSQNDHLQSSTFKGNEAKKPSEMAGGNSNRNLQDVPDLIDFSETNTKEIANKSASADDADFLPIIRPLYYNVLNKRRLCIPLDSPLFDGTFPTLEQMLVFKTRTDGDEAISDLSKHWQLTLKKQAMFLIELDSLLGGDYPCGLKEKPIAEMVTQRWLTMDDGEDEESTDEEMEDIKPESSPPPTTGIATATKTEASDKCSAISDRRSSSATTSSEASDLICFDDDFAAAHNLTTHR